MENGDICSVSTRILGEPAWRLLDVHKCVELSRHKTDKNYSEDIAAKISTNTTRNNTVWFGNQGKRY